MNSSYERIRMMKATRLTFALMGPLFGLLMFPLVVKAEEPQNLEGNTVQAPAELENGVESPGIPQAVSPSDSYEIVWQWSAPSHGLTPDATKDTEQNPDIGDVLQQQEQLVIENASDIVQFGYQLFRNDVPIGESKAVGSNVYSVTTPVIQNGTYVLKLWSITRGGATSTAAEGLVVIATSVEGPLPPIKEEIIPKPIDTTAVVKKQAASESAGSSTLSTESLEKIVANSLETGDAEVLAASDDGTATPVDAAGVVKPSSQGWMIIGLPWYIWLLIVAGVVTAGRGIFGYLNGR